MWLCAGVTGLEPADDGFGDRCLGRLATPLWVALPVTSDACNGQGFITFISDTGGVRAGLKPAGGSGGVGLWKRRDSNSQPSACKAGALPIVLRPHTHAST